jgi:hypothetical protein
MHSAKATKAAPRDERDRRLEIALEEGLRGTFPASDPVAVLEPAPERPGEDRRKPAEQPPSRRFAPTSPQGGR